MEAILAYIDGKRTLQSLKEDELSILPVDYLIRHVRPGELLDVWHKLPNEYKCNFNLQIRLPCYVHYNRPDAQTHFDGPADAQADCHACNYYLKKINE